MSKTKEVTIEQYREKLSSVCERASESTQKWLERHPGASRQEILDATYKITQAYGLAASTLAANKYDQDVALAEKQGFLKPGQIKEAEVWDPLGYGSIARAINGTLKNDSKEKLPDTIERMVKRFAEDTTLMNARRDGAEYAWIPAGDTCVFCLSLASNGWQRASRSTAEGNHADHIHPHCDCTFSVRFSKDTKIKGYNPEKIKARIEACEGDTWKEKLNSLRRELYAEKKENERGQMNYGPIKNIDTKELGTKGEKEDIVKSSIITDYYGDTVYISDRIFDEPEAVMEKIEPFLDKAYELVGKNHGERPQIIIADITEIGDAYGRYLYDSNIMVLVPQLFGDEEERSIFNTHLTIHELLHWSDCQEMAKDYPRISENELVPLVIDWAKTQLDSIGIDAYNVNIISSYAEEMYEKGRYDEVYVEYRTKEKVEAK